MVRRLLGISIACFALIVSQPVHAQRGLEIFDFVLQEAEREMQRQQQREYRERQRQESERQHQRFVQTWRACFANELAACDRALTYPYLGYTDRQRLLDQQSRILSARQEAAERVRQEERRQREDQQAAERRRAEQLAREREDAERERRATAAAQQPNVQPITTGSITTEVLPRSDGAQSANDPRVIQSIVILVMLLGLASLFAVMRQPVSAITSVDGNTRFVPPPLPATHSPSQELGQQAPAPHQRATAGAAIELAHAYIREFHDDHGDALTDPTMARQILETLALVTKQIRIAETNDPLATITIENKDGSPLSIDLKFLKSHALYYEGVCHAAANPKRAIRCLEQALAIEPNAPNAYFTLGFIHHALLNRKDAVEAYQQALALDPANLEYRKALDRAQNISGSSVLIDRTFSAGRKTANAVRLTAAIGILGLTVFFLVYYPMGVLAVIGLGIGSAIHNWASR